MYLSKFDQKYIKYKYNKVTGQIDLSKDWGDKKLNSPSILHNGLCHETTKGWVVVYGQGGNLFFQFNTTIWKLTDKNTQYSYSTLNGAYFRIEDENASFEISYDYWLSDNNVLLTDLDDPDEDHDFFANIIWLYRPENAKRIADTWSRRNKEKTQEY